MIIPRRNVRLPDREPGENLRNLVQCSGSVCACECVFGEKRKNGEEEGQITLLTY